MASLMTFNVQGYKLRKHFPKRLIFFLLFTLLHNIFFKGTVMQII